MWIVIQDCGIRKQGYIAYRDRKHIGQISFFFERTQ